MTTNKGIKQIKSSAGSIRDMISAAGPAISQGMQTLGYIRPEYDYIATAVCATLAIWGNFANRKASDFMKNFYDNKDRIVPAIVQDEKFISVFFDLFERNIKESNEGKRQLLKNYILNMACGVEPNFNEHTKLISILNSITLDELAVLRLWDEDGYIGINPKYRNSFRITASDIKHCILDRRVPNRELDEGEKNIMAIMDNKSSANQIFLSLGHKDLLFVLSESNSGSGEEVKVFRFNALGKIFLDFVRG